MRFVAIRSVCNKIMGYIPVPDKPQRKKIIIDAHYGTDTIDGRPVTAEHIEMWKSAGYDIELRGVI